AFGAWSVSCDHPRSTVLQWPCSGGARPLQVLRSTVWLTFRERRPPMAIDEAKLDQLIGKFVTDFGAAMHGATVVIGDKLGLYKVLADKGPLTGAALAEHTGYDVRLVEEWLNAQFVSGYSEYDPSDGTFRLTDEQAALLADESTPAFLAGAMTIAAAVYK